MKTVMFRRSMYVVLPVAAAALTWSVMPIAQGGTRAAPHGVGAAIPPQPDDPNLLTKVSDCETPKSDVVVQENNIDPTSNQSPINPTQVKGMTKTVTVGGTGPSCAIVHVVARAHAAAPSDQPYDSMNLSVWMDGHVGHPAEYQFTAADNQLGGT